MLGKKTKDSLPPAQLPGRNDPCHCGSGKKYKKCHEDSDAAAQHTVLEKQWKEAEKEAAKQAESQKSDSQASDSQAAGNPTNPASANLKSANPAVRHNTRTVPKFNMPRKTGGGGA
jgi:hypothetical protein